MLEIDKHSYVLPIILLIFWLCVSFQTGSFTHMVHIPLQYASADPPIKRRRLFFQCLNLGLPLRLTLANMTIANVTQGEKACLLLLPLQFLLFYEQMQDAC